VDPRRSVAVTLICEEQVLRFAQDDKFMGNHMQRTLLILLAVTSGLACSGPQAEPKQQTVREVIQQHARADTRPDSFTIAADRGRVLGDSAAPVWVVVVTDFQCGACKDWHEDVLPLLRERYVSKGRIRVAYLNKPLPTHLNGTASALVAACAAAEGKFWETSGRIFATQAKWKALPDARPFLDSLALQSGVDSAAYHICSDRARGQKLLRNDEERTTAAGVDSVPTFFIGTHKRVGMIGPVRLFAVVDSALAGK
jgi:protein-disulfide isomerase